METLKIEVLKTAGIQSFFQLFSRKCMNFHCFGEGESKYFPKGNDAPSAGLGKFLRIPGALKNLYKNL